ncbi:3'(2'),5'-bisphosphate nucleotidase CysQ [Lichenicola cladoniae]|uniref:3'(2'),5'-bisphosphate nucleotidase CysQ n=1 Tax=Lichenicola cladoniae TaxID=1484109 RepID=A0A6M8HWU6_9PROT|nr:3'(2'),5'-bisphosphate nucleotidase CysQ [Acetobacteraceae bacterium]QKE92665.1 3'(2'),5'-bisphosphate nucleotidase CysQ [Lichenicola cladoniae]
MLDGFVAAALEAGGAILEIYRRPSFETNSKDDGSPVTEADTRAEAIIHRALALLAPGLAVVAEEAASAGLVPETAHDFILVDPLDGTREFVSRNGDFTVNIGLIRNGVAVLGVVYAPALGLVYSGQIGTGARRAQVAGGLPAGWTPIEAGTPGTGGLRVVGSRSHMSDETRRYLEAFEVADLVPVGSSLKFCKVAEGGADLYPRMGRTMEWDTAAGDAVLRAAGGQVLTLDGARLGYGKRRQPGDADFANPWFVATGAFDMSTVRRTGG